jgi:hypothetical protein
LGSRRGTAFHSGVHLRRSPPKSSACAYPSPRKLL